MTVFRWDLKDADGNRIRASEPFDTREQAESWMGSEWAGLRDEGAESVVLLEGVEVVYEMGLGEA